MRFSVPTLVFECESSTKIDDINDDIKREAAFAQQALDAIVAARRIIIAAKVPFSRPEGYFCEMLKTEEQMKSIEQKKADEKTAAKAAEDARKQRLNRKFGKKVQIHKEAEKQQQRSETMKKLNMMRKRPQRAERDDFDVEVDATAEAEEAFRRAPPSKKPKGGKEVSKKREVRNEKYGFGGKKRGLKKNDKRSAEQDDFDVARNRRSFQGMGKTSSGGKGGKKGLLRPGKQRRQQMRNHKNSKK